MAQYGARISGPLLDRIDLRIEVGAVTAADLILPPPAEGSKETAARVAAARERQTARYAERSLGPAITNATCPATVMEEVAAPDAEGTALIRDAAESMRLSARGFHRTLRVARPWPISTGRKGCAVYIWPKRCRIEPERRGR